MNVKGILAVLERWFLRASILALFLLILSQAVLTSDGTRFFLCRVERFEGSPIKLERIARNQGQRLARDQGQDVSQPAALHEATGWITLRCIDQKTPEAVKVLVNGRAVTDFDYGDAVIMVHHGDLVEIDGSSNPQPLYFEVAETSPNVAKPARGTEVYINKSIESLGNVSVNPLRTR
ncbi:MAG TPA: hypothetical protein GXX51_06130 [Firmicutes bacterium]|nr:hypothetical protein [Bacillota bacterium]